MGLLSNPDSSTKLSKILSAVRRWHQSVSILLYLVGVGWICGIFWPAFSQHTYFSENALLPGLVDEQFNEIRLVQEHLRSLQSSPSPIDYVTAAMRDSRLEVYEQNFTLTNPLQPTDTHQHRNVYGIVRAPRANGIESLVVVSPIDKRYLPGVAILLALVDFCRSQVYWAKDLIFVFTEADEIGVQAWLSAYHDSPLEHLKVESLQGHSGAIQAAVVFQSEIMDITHMDLKYQMVNGQLPNLDLFNLVSRMAEKYGIESTIHRKKNPIHAFSEKGYKRFLSTAAHGLLVQATGRPTGLHSVFGQYGIEAVSMVPYKQGRNSKTLGAISQVRVLEGILRSLNNLLERFHQSFFFYILASTDRFVSIGIYMPAVGFMIVTALIKAACLWVDIQESNESETAPSKTKTNVEPIGSQISNCISIWLVAHLIGIGFYHLPTLLVSGILKGIQMESGDKLLSCAVGLMAGVPVIVQFFRIKNRSGQTRDFRFLRCVALLELSLVVGAASLLNFALGVSLAIILLPFFIPIGQPKRVIRKLLQLFVLVLVNPLVFALISSAVYLLVINPENKNWNSESLPVLFQASVGLVKFSLTRVITDSFLFRSWLYGFGCLCVIPTWVLFFSLACM